MFPLERRLFLIQRIIHLLVKRILRHVHVGCDEVALHVLVYHLLVLSVHLGLHDGVRVEVLVRSEVVNGGVLVDNRLNSLLVVLLQVRLSGVELVRKHSFT